MSETAHEIPCGDFSEVFYSVVHCSSIANLIAASPDALTFITTSPKHISSLLKISINLVLIKLFIKSLRGRQ